MAECLCRILEAAGNGTPQPIIQQAAVAQPFAGAVEERQAEFEELLLRSDPDTTEKESSVQVRVGQQLFRKRVFAFEKCCRVTGIGEADFLVASHIKPWRESNSHERLDGENGLLLTPTIDRLFDRGFIGFEDTGELIISSVLSERLRGELGLTASGGVNRGAFTRGQRKYLEYHRERILRRLPDESF